MFVADATDAPHDDDRRAADLLKNYKGPVLLALNKIDALPVTDPRRRQFEALRQFDGTFEISALHDRGLDELKTGIIERLPPGEAYFPPDMIGDRTPEFHVEELIREQALGATARRDSARRRRRRRADGAASR